MSEMERPGRGRRSIVALLAFGWLGILLVFVMFGDQLAPHDPLAQNIDALFSGPSPEHWLGTDYLGRDILSRLLSGSRLSVLAAALAVMVSLVGGSVPGLMAAFLPPWFDYLANRTADAIMSLPSIVFTIAFVAVAGNRLVPAMLSVGFLGIPYFFRITRTVTLTLRNEQYMDVAALFGVPKSTAVVTHVLPKIVPAVAVTTASAMANFLIAIASLTFIGVGVTPPEPTWGGMLASDLDYLAVAPWSPLVPGTAIVATTAAFNIVADLIRDRSGLPRFGRKQSRRPQRPAWTGTAR